MSFDRRTAAKLGLLGSLYLSQGMPFGFLDRALPQLLREAGTSLGAIGLASALATPWGIKFLWAPLVDRYGSARLGRRRSWILPCQLAAATLFAALALAPQGEHALPVLLATMLVVSFISATQDIATDALTVQTLTAEERGLGNGVQVGGFRVGQILGGGGLLVVFASYGASTAFALMALLLAIATIPIFLHREAPPAPEVEVEVGMSARDALLGFIRRPGALAMLALIGLYKTGDALGSKMLGPMLTDVGIGLGESGVLFGTVGFTTGLAGALVGGVLVRPLGRTRALVLFSALQALSMLGYGWIGETGDASGIAWAMGLEHFTGGMATVALFTCMMDFCRPGHEAVDYTVQAAFQVTASGLPALFSGFVAQALGYGGHFGLAASIGLAAAAFAAVAHPRIQRSLGVHP